MYFQRFLRWPIYNQLWANVARFLANNAWYPYVWEDPDPPPLPPAQRTQNKNTTKYL